MKTEIRELCEKFTSNNEDSQKLYEEILILIDKATKQGREKLLEKACDVYLQGVQSAFESISKHIADASKVAAVAKDELLRNS